MKKTIIKSVDELDKLLFWHKLGRPFPEDLMCKKNVADSLASPHRYNRVFGFSVQYKGYFISGTNLLNGSNMLLKIRLANDNF